LTHFRSRRLLLTPLTLFYSSIPLVLTLIVSSVIWQNEYGASTTSSPSTSTSLSSPFPDLTSLFPNLPLPPPTSAYPREEGILGWIAGYSRAELKSGLAQAGSGQTRGWASEALLRKLVGGGSAVVAFSGAPLSPFLSLVPSRLAAACSNGHSAFSSLRLLTSAVSQYSSEPASVGRWRFWA
jgi:hypothetical protein